jgi:hypothetical protein
VVEVEPVAARELAAGVEAGVFDMRRTLTIIAVVIVFIGIAVAVYFIFFSGTGPSLTGSAGPNPFGTAGSAMDSTGGTTGGEAASPDSTGDNTATQVAPKLTEITPGPVAKGVLVMNAGVNEASGTPAGVTVEYIKRESGNIYSYESANGGITRLSNKTIPGIQEASWLPSGALAFVRYVSAADDKSQHIQTYALPGNGEDGYFLQEDLSQAFAVGSTTLFTLLPSTDGSVGTFSAPDGTNVRTLFSSPLSNISILSSRSGLLFAETKPSAFNPGYLFSVSSSGTFTPILGPTSGLEALPSPSGKELLLSSVESTGVHLAILDLATHAITALPIATFAEKCVWAVDSSAIYCGAPTAFPGDLPDDWFQGVVAFSDKLWRIDLSARVATLVADLPSLVSTPLDVIAPAIDAESSTLVFMNKQDGSLWAYQL